MNLLRYFSPRRAFGPHDFAIATHVAEPPPEPKKLGLVHYPKVRTVYPEIGHYYPAPTPSKVVHGALTKLKRETSKKLR